MRALIALAVSVALFVSSLPATVMAEPASTPPKKSKAQIRSARRYFNEGLKLFAQKEYLRAAAKFEHAYDITEDPVVLFNVGEAYARAGRNEQAIAAYRGYLHGKPSAPDRSEVERKISVLEASLTANTRPTESVEVKPTPSRKTPPSLPALPPIEPTPAPALTEAPQQETSSNTGGSTLAVMSWVGLGLSVALLATSGVLALGARSRENDIVDRQMFLDPNTGRPHEFNSGTTAADYKALQDDGNSYKDLSVLFLILGGVAAAGTVTLFVVRAMRNRNSDAAQGIRPPFQLTPQMASRGARMGLSWSF